MDNLIALYNLNKLELEPPNIYTGHKSSFYVKACLGLQDQIIVSGSSENQPHVWNINKKESIG